MQKFRRKPTEVEAVQWTGGDDNFTKVIGPWMNGAGRLFRINGVTKIIVRCEDEPDDSADVGDWIVRMPNGRFYSVSDDAFKQTY